MDFEIRMRQLAEEHCHWFVKMLQPLLRTFMEHGYKHGREDALKELPCTKQSKEESSIFLVLCPDDDVGCGDLIIASCSTQEKASRVVEWYNREATFGPLAYISNRALDDHPILRKKQCND